MECFLKEFIPFIQPDILYNVCIPMCLITNLYYNNHWGSTNISLNPISARGRGKYFPNSGHNVI